MICDDLAAHYSMTVTMTHLLLKSPDIGRGSWAQGRVLDSQDAQQQGPLQSRPGHIMWLSYYTTVTSPNINVFFIYIIVDMAILIVFFEVSIAIFVNHIIIIIDQVPIFDGPMAELGAHGTYSELFVACLKNFGVLCIGLYR